MINKVRYSWLKRIFVVLFCVWVACLIVNPASASWYQSYPYEKDVVIQGNGATQPNYVARYDLWNATGTDSGINLYLNGHNFNNSWNVAFTDTSDVPLNSQIAVYNSSYASAYIGISSLPASGTTIRMYYGNSTFVPARASSITNLTPINYYSQDNGGVERRFFTDKFTDNTSGDYTGDVTRFTWDTTNKTITKNTIAEPAVIYTKEKTSADPNFVFSATVKPNSASESGGITWYVDSNNYIRTLYHSGEFYVQICNAGSLISWSESFALPSGASVNNTWVQVII